MPVDLEGCSFVTNYKTETPMTTHSAPKQRKTKWNRAVSQKFYLHICQQLHSVCQLSDDINEDKVIKCIDDYIDTGRADVDFTDTETVVFTLLQPLIDKAIERSRRARAAAARRRQSREAAASTDAVSPTANPSAAAPVADPVIIRDDRHAMRRAAARDRRLAKHQKRLARRQAVLSNGTS